MTFLPLKHCRRQRSQPRSLRYVGGALLLAIIVSGGSWHFLNAQDRDRSGRFGRQNQIEVEGIRPTNFGSRESEVPEDPRAAFGGQMYDFPVWEVSK